MRTHTQALCASSKDVLLMDSTVVVGTMAKLDEARQAQADKEASLREPTPAPQEYEYGQPDLPFMFDMNMYTYLGMCLTMTYLRKYAYTSLGMSFLMGCLAQGKNLLNLLIL